MIISKSKREKIYNLQKIATRTEVLSTRPAKMENIATAERYTVLNVTLAMSPLIGYR